MKVSFGVASLCLVASTAAYPQLLGVLPLPDLNILKGLEDQIKQAASNPQVAAQNPGWSPAQRISTTGLNEWRAPGPNDARGPCPGLNALANHGYLPRNGFATVPEFIVATTTVYGMGPLFATVLSLYGAAINGNGLGWSIAGQARTGIGGSHGNYEGDNSPLRGDLFQYGSNTDLVINQFQRLVDLQPDDATANYDIDVIAQFRADRFQESKEKNPHFFYGPFSGTVVSAAAYAFIFRLFANHTAEHPAGILNLDVLKSFMSIEGERGSFRWVPGHERIPNAWHRRAFSDPYEVFGLGPDVEKFEALAPGVRNPGCNQGTVNSYTAINSSYQDFDFSGLGGVCFAVAAVSGVVINEPVFGNLLQQLLLPVQNALDCTTVPGRNDTVADICPGYTFYGGPIANVAPGAIQS